MNSAAAPRYVTDAAGDFAGVPPGHQFNLYLPIWNKQWGLDKDSAKADALRKALRLGDGAKVLDALRARQQALAAAYPEGCCLTVEAKSTSPFATGLGLEHPVENGFAFLSPYSVPYLAGSGVKGVLRRAAEELQQEDEVVLDKDIINALFGPEDPAVLGTGAQLPDKNRRRGALTCWDVFPMPAKGEMVVEIMTPHYGHYYQEGKTPHDAGKPNPIAFLAVPAESDFTFVVTCEPVFLPERLSENWKQTVERIFDRAFDWVGFGAKTAVGYGALRRNIEREAALNREREERARQELESIETARREAERQTRLAALDPLDREIEELLAARLDKNQPEISVLINAAKKGKWSGESKRRIAMRLQQMMQAAKTWKPSTQAKRPEKDRDHQNTLLVIGWLKEP